MKLPGKLITFEGIDGSGKTTLVRLVHAALQQTTAEVVLTKEPGGTTLGKELRAILHTQKALVCDLAEYLLFAADRAQHFHEIIVPALQRGAIVLADRLADSSLAYQGYGRGLNTEQIARTNAWAMQGLQPDLVVFCKIDPAIAAQRIRQRNEALTSFEQEKIDFWQRVDAGYEAIFAQRTNVLRIDASQPSDIQADLVVNALQAPVRRSSI